MSRSEAAMRPCSCHTGIIRCGECGGVVRPAQKRRQSKKVPVGRMKPSKEEFRQQTADLRTQLLELTDGVCEFCGVFTMRQGHMHHTVGGSGKRRQQQSISNVAWLCGLCHDHLHRNPDKAREFASEIARRRKDAA